MAFLLCTTLPGRSRFCSGQGDGKGSPSSNQVVPVHALVARTMQAKLVALEYKLTPRDAKAWWLEVVWRFQNPAESPLHVLSKGPLSMLDIQPLVINHTATGHPI